MLALYVNNIFVCEADTPRSVILMGISVKLTREDSEVTIGNDWGDRWTLEKYIDLIESLTSIRIPEKDKLP